VREIVLKLVTFVVMMFFIFGIFWGVKRQNWLTIPEVDSAMQPDYNPGTYHVGPQPTSQSELILGKAYAYMVPKSSEREKRAAWLVAKEGQRVEFKDKGVYVDGAKCETRLGVGITLLAPFVVPRGTVYLLSTMPEKDSLTRGPIPFRNLLGKL
jgi:hypothetical protein